MEILTRKRKFLKIGVIGSKYEQYEFFYFRLLWLVIEPFIEQECGVNVETLIRKSVMGKGFLLICVFFCYFH